MTEINISLTKEEIRVIHQLLNEVCSGLHFEDSEFESRVGTDKNTAISLMKKLEVFYVKG